MPGSFRDVRGFLCIHTALQQESGLFAFRPLRSSCTAAHARHQAPLPYGAAAQAWLRLAPAPPGEELPSHAVSLLLIQLRCLRSSLIRTAAEGPRSNKRAHGLTPVSRWATTIPMIGLIPVPCVKRVRSGRRACGQRRGDAPPADHAGPQLRQRGRAGVSRPRAPHVAGGLPARCAAGGQRRRVACAPHRCVPRATCIRPVS